MSKNKWGKLLVFAAVVGTTAAAVSYYLKYRAFNKELDEDFHDFEGDFEDDEDEEEANAPERTYVKLSQKTAKAKEAIKGATGQAVNKAKNAATIVKETVKNVTDKAKNTGKEAAETAGEAAEKLADKAAETQETVAEAVQDTVEVVEEAAAEAADAGKEIVKDAADSVKKAAACACEDVTPAAEAEEKPAEESGDEIKKSDSGEPTIEESAE